MPALIELTRWTTVLLVCLVLAVAGTSDVRNRRIPNWTVLATAALFGVWLFVGAAVSLISSLEAALFVFVCSVALYFLGVIGAGDSKLATAVALFAGFSRLPQFFVYMSLAGGILVLCMLVMQPARALVMLQMKGQGGLDRGVPYGVAIAFAGAMLVLTPVAQRWF